MNFDEFRDPIHLGIDVYQAWRKSKEFEFGNHAPPPNNEKVKEFLSSIEKYQKVRSTQVAALALTIADMIQKGK